MKAQELLTKYLNEDLTEEEKVELNSYYSLGEIDAFVTNMNRLTLETVPAEEEWNRFQKEGRPEDKTSKKIWWWIIGVALLIASLLAVYLYDGSYKEVENTTNAPMEYAMIDNTNILISPGSKITYSEDHFAENRRIWLEGHAYFDVRKKGPFVVFGDEVQVHVKGTRFDIWHLSEGANVVECYEGRVEVVTAASSSSVLVGGQMLTTQKSNSKITQSRSPNRPAWIDGELIYSNIPLNSIYKELERYFGVSFEGELSESEFTGNLPTDDLNKCITRLSGVTNHTYTIQGRSVLVGNK